jgi:hypothetical protein
MKVNITVVATKTFMAGLEPSTDIAMLEEARKPGSGINFEDSTGRADRAYYGLGQRPAAHSLGCYLSEAGFKFFGAR